MELQVVIGIIVDINKNKVFLLKRKKGVHMGCMWEFPGGKVNEGENFHDTLIREIYEETSIQVIKYHFLDNIQFKDKHTRLSLNFFMVDEFSGYPNNPEGNSMCWVEISDLHHIEMPPANLNIIRKIQLLFN